MTTDSVRNGMRAADLGADGWAKPWSDNGGDCLEAKKLPGGRVALRQSTDPDSPVAVHLILWGPDGRVLLMRRTGTDYGEGQLAFPAGHVDLGETPTESIIRETEEEIGISLDPDRLEPAGVMFRRSSEPRVDFFIGARPFPGSGWSSPGLPGRFIGGMVT